MADWFRCKPLPLLDALQELSDDAQLVYIKALLQIYHRDGRIPAAALRSRFPNWRPKRLARALEELIAASKLIGTATGDLHNEYAMHELAQLEELTRKLAEGGGKGGRVRAERDRLARRLAERNRSPDMFEPNPVETPQPERKSKEINESREARLKHRAPAPAHEENPVEPALNRGSTGIEPALNSGSVAFQIGQRDQKPNEINATTQGGLKHRARVRGEIDTEEEYPLGVPPVEIDEVEVIEGVVIEDAPRGRKQPMPPGWLPTFAALSERVQERVGQWPEDEFGDQQTKFLEWAEATDQRFVKWDRAFGNWCIKHHEQRRARHGGKQSGWKARA